MAVDPLLILLCAPGILLVGVAKAGFGGSATFAGTVYLSLVIGPYDAIAVMLPILALMDLLTVPAFWRYSDRRNSLALLPSLLFGALLGAALLHFAVGATLHISIGIIAIAAALYQLSVRLGWRINKPTEFTWWRSALLGTASGMLGVVAHAASLALALLLVPQSLNKTTLHATLIVALAFLNLLKIPLYLELDLFRPETLLLSAALAPVALVSVRLGFFLHNVVQQRTFELVLLIAVAAGGGNLLMFGLSDLG